MEKVNALRGESKYLPWLVGAAVCSTIALVYLTTVQRDINGNPDLVDAGEFQNALYLCGIVNPTGYPLYLIVGWYRQNVATRTFRNLGTYRIKLSERLHPG